MAPVDPTSWRNDTIVGPGDVMGQGETVLVDSGVYLGQTHKSKFKINNFRSFLLIELTIEDLYYSFFYAQGHLIITL